MKISKSIASATLFSISISAGNIVSARPQIQPYICVVNNTDVNIRDARTLQTFGKLNYGEFLESYNWYYEGGRPTLRMRVIDQESYHVVFDSKSGQVRLVSATYVAVV
jgi:hypothetical protein